MSKWTFGELQDENIRICARCGEVTLEDEMHVCRREDKVTDKDPLSKIEDKAGMMDMGRMGYYVYCGAMEEGATEQEALTIMIGYFAGIAASNNFRPNQENDEEAPSS